MLREFVPQLFRGFRIRYAAEVIMILELDWGMFRRAAEDSMDLLRDPLDVPEQDVRIFRRLATESRGDGAPRPDRRWLSV